MNSPPVIPKKGLAWTYMICDDLASTRVAWAYHWYPKPRQCAQEVELVPMIRDADQWASLCWTSVAKHYRHGERCIARTNAL